MCAIKYGFYIPFHKFALITPFLPIDFDVKELQKINITTVQTVNTLILELLSKYTTV